MDWERFHGGTEDEIERSVPKAYRNLPDDLWDRAVVVEPVAKAPISIRLDRDVLEWIGRSGPRYQPRINAVLRSYMMRVQQQAQVGRPARRTRRTG